MNIRNRLLVQFSAIVLSILIIFATGVWYFSSSHRKSEYYARLEDRATNTARLLLDVEEVGAELLNLIDRNTNALFEERIAVFNQNNQLVYFNPPEGGPKYDKPDIDATRKKGQHKYNNKQREILGITYNYKDQEYVIIISAFDKFGYSKLQNLQWVLISFFLFGLIITLVFGIFFSKRALAPISNVINQVNNITGSNLNQRVDEGNQKDEIAQLAITFNQMLKRIEDAFILQRDFVANAAHELRTPFSVLQAEVDFALMQDRNADFYKKVLSNQSDEIKKLSKISNGLLELARLSYDQTAFGLHQIRMDELLIETCESTLQSYPNYKVNLKFGDMPDNDNEISILGNEQLLSIAIKNLIDNACKFSNEAMVDIEMLTNNHHIQILFKDNGMGIPEDDIDNIFIPFYRGKNTHFVAGYGIGLALIQKIIQLHNGTISVTSTLNQGSVFTIKIPALTSGKI